MGSKPNACNFRGWEALCSPCETHRRGACSWKAEETVRAANREEAAALGRTSVTRTSLLFFSNATITDISRLSDLNSLLEQADVQTRHMADLLLMVDRVVAHRARLLEQFSASLIELAKVETPEYVDRYVLAERGAYAAFAWEKCRLDLAAADLDPSPVGEDEPDVEEYPIGHSPPPQSRPVFVEPAAPSSPIVRAPPSTVKNAEAGPSRPAKTPLPPGTPHAKRKRIVRRGTESPSPRGLTPPI